MIFFSLLSSVEIICHFVLFWVNAQKGDQKDIVTVVAFYLGLGLASFVDVHSFQKKFYFYVFKVYGHVECDRVQSAFFLFFRAKLATSHTHLTLYHPLTQCVLSVFQKLSIILLLSTTPTIPCKTFFFLSI